MPAASTTSPGMARSTSRRTSSSRPIRAAATPSSCSGTSRSTRSRQRRSARRSPRRRHGSGRRLRGLHVQRHGGQQVNHLRRRGHDDDRHVDSRHRAGTVQPDQRSRWPRRTPARIPSFSRWNCRPPGRIASVSRASSRPAVTSRTRSRTPIFPRRCCRTTTCCSSAPPESSSVRSAEQNTLTNRPAVLGGIKATIAVQMVISRANTPTPSRNVADRIRWVGFGNTSPQEYTSYLDPVTYGHNSAAGANGVAAYPFYAPFVPEAFTSPGPSTIYFDKDSKRLRHVEYRQKPIWRRWTAPTRRSSRQIPQTTTTRSRTSSERARRRRMPRRLQHSCWMLPADRDR